MKHPEFRAVMKDKHILFDLSDCFAKMSELDTDDYDDLLDWIASGNTPDRLTGLCDRNETPIYEQDIVDIYDFDFDKSAMQKRDGDDEDTWDWKNPLYKCKGNDIVTLERFGFWLKNEKYGYEGEGLAIPYMCQIVGNTHTTPLDSAPVEVEQ